MSSFSYIIQSILQYATKKELDNDPEFKILMDKYSSNFKQMSIELDDLIKQRDKLIKKYK
jgi:hypothetical protein